MEKHYLVEDQSIYLKHCFYIQHYLNSALLDTHLEQYHGICGLLRYTDILMTFIFALNYGIDKVPRAICSALPSYKRSSIFP